MRFENYLNENLNSDFKDVKNGNSSYNCCEVAIDCSKFKENHTKYKTRISNEKKKFDSLVSEINVNRLKKIEEERRKAKEQREKEEYEKANAEQIRVDKLIKYNKRKEITSKFVRILTVLLLVAIFVLYIVYSFNNYPFVEHFGTTGFVWILIGAGVLVLGLSVLTIVTNHFFSRTYAPTQKNEVLFKGRKKANFLAILTLIVVAGIAYVFVITKIAVDNLPYTIFDERSNALLNKEDATDYETNDTEIMDLYVTYMNFSDSEKNKCKEKSSFEKYINGYNVYKVNLVKENLDAITVDNASELLVSTIEAYDALIYDQRRMITSDMTSKYNKYLTPYKQVILISDVYDNILDKYDSVEDVRSKYLLLPLTDKEYVYNSYLMDEFELVYVSLGNLEFNLLEDDTYSVTAKSNFNAENLTIPRYYNSKIVSKLESLKNCTTLQELVIPNTVTTIEYGALNGCSGLAKIELPFVGVSLNPTFGGGNFGAIFGDDVYDGGTKITQYNKYTYYNQSYSWCIPNNISEVKITGSNVIKYSAFYGCNMIKKLYLPKTITQIESFTFKDTNLTNVYYNGTIEDWNMISIDSNSYIDTAIIYFYTINGANESRSGNWWYYDANRNIVTKKI